MSTLARQTQLARTTTQKLLEKMRKTYMNVRALEDAMGQEEIQLTRDIYNKEDDKVTLTKKGIRRMRQGHILLCKSFHDIKHELIARGEWAWLQYIADEE